MSEYSELEHMKDQIRLRANRDALSLDLYAKRKNMVEYLTDMIGHFEHCIDNAKTLKQELDSKDHIDYDGIDTTCELNYLIRDHDEYSSIMHHIEYLKNYKVSLEDYQCLASKLDY